MSQRDPDEGPVLRIPTGIVLRSPALGLRLEQECWVTVKPPRTREEKLQLLKSLGELFDQIQQYELAAEKRAS